MTKKTEKIEEDKQPSFQIQRIYVKDLSFEAPQAPEVFRKEWKPEVKVNVHDTHAQLEADVFEVVLKVTAEVTLGESTAFVVEVHQAGIFTIKNFPEAHRHHALGSMCLNILFPYAREAISDAVTRGGFPQLLIAPVNFEAVYQQKMKQEQSAG